MCGVLDCNLNEARLSCARAVTCEARRKAPFLPYLAYAPPDFALMLSFAGGGIYAPGKFLFDANGNLWSGVNWMPGSEAGVAHNIGGGTIKFSPNGTALSPAVTGFT